MRSTILLLCLASCSALASDWMPKEFRVASIKHNIPASILWSLALQESRRKDEFGVYKPWPWTVNHAGVGMFFSTKEEAVAFVEKKLASGAKPISLDLGMCQGNLHYNYDHIYGVGIAEFFEPEASLDFAGGNLRSCMDGGRTLTECIGRYHNNREGIASNYRRRVGLRLLGK